MVASSAKFRWNILSTRIYRVSLKHYQPLKETDLKIRLPTKQNYRAPHAWLEGDSYAKENVCCDQNV
jgi:hypothetical protein